MRAGEDDELSGWTAVENGGHSIVCSSGSPSHNAHL
jgi:hypothetical protein